MDVVFFHSQTTVGVEGRTWCISEVEYVKPPTAADSTGRDPPVVVTQHAKPPRKFVILSAQVSDILL